MLVSKKFHFSTLLYESSTVKVYRGYCLANKEPLIFKILKNDEQNQDAIANFKREYHVVEELEIEGVVKKCSLERFENTFMMVFKDMGGIALNNILKRKNFSIEEFLTTAIELCSILESIHQNNVIHKDINPNNIICNEQNGKVEIIDFGIASKATQKNKTFTPLETIEGTLPYISPEQTGRMNRTVDHRTDLYSLGVTFYEMLAGRLPFTADDPMEIIHAHLAQLPTPLARIKAIPSYISDIIDKLLAKMAEDRYQSFSGLRYDLQESLAIFLGTKEEYPLVPGSKDVANRFQIPQKLYGRKQEIMTVESSFEKMLNGDSELLLIKGYSGVGKSSVVYELHKNLTREQGYFFEGKFDQYKKNTPYSAWIQAFEGFINYLLMESDAQITYWKKRIIETVKDEGKVLTDVIPNLELIIGQQPAIPELGTQESQNRFNYIFMKFIGAIAQKEHPVIIFLDDLQWIDYPSLNLLEMILSNSDIQYLHLIGAYRDNEVSEDHPLQQALIRTKKNGHSLESIHLENLTIDDIYLLLSETFQIPIRSVKKLGDLIYSKTEGNAFFTHQFLHSMRQKDLITFDTRKNEWQWDQEGIEALEISDNVIVLLVDRLMQLSSNVQDLLKLASIIGNSFSKQFLSIIAELPKEQLEKQLQICINEGILYESKELYTFVHDRIQQAAYTLTAEQHRSDTHWRIGNLLLSNLSPKERENKIYDIANHLLKGKDREISKEENKRVLHILLDAAKRAKKANAYELATTYLKEAISTLNSESWSTEYNLTLSLYNEIAEISYLTKEYQTMEEHANCIFANSRCAEDTIPIYHTKIQAHIGKNESQEAIRTALSVLAKLGLTLEENPEESDIGAAFGLIAELRAKHKDSNLIELPEIHDECQVAIIQILASIIGPAYNVNPPLLLLIVLKIVEISLTKGNTALSAIGYVMYGLFLAGMMNDFDTAYAFGELAFAVTDKYNGQIVLPRVTHLANCFIYHWKTAAQKNLPAFKMAYEQALIVGDHEFASHALTNYCATAFTTGYDLHTLRKDAKRYAEINGTKLEQEVMRSIVTLFQQCAINLISGDVKKATLLDGKACKEAELLQSYEKVQNATGLALLYTLKQFLQYHFGLFDEAYSTAEKARPYLPSLMGLNISVSFVLYDSLTLLELCRNDTTKNREILLQRVVENQEKLKIWADSAPMNHRHKWALVEAVRESLNGTSDRAEQLFEEAIDAAQTNEYPNEEALANELYARYWLDRNRTKFAQLFLNAATALYKAWGAATKIHFLQQKYPQWLEPGNETEGTLFETGTFSGTLNVDTILKSTYALTEEIVLDKLLGKMLKIVMENAGAEEGFLLLEKDGSWVVEAELSVNEPVLKTLHSQPLAPSQSLNIMHISGEIVNYVLRTRESVMLGDAIKSEKFGQSHYIQQAKPKSILAMPLLHKKDLKGILYLENNLATNAFTKSHLNILQLLSAEMAITIQNAQLYSILQQKNEELQHSTNIARKASQVKSDFLANLSHEIRTPMNAIVGVTNFLLEEKEVSKEVKNHIEDIHQNTSALMNIVNHILDFSDVESGNLNLKKAAVNLPSLISSIEDLLRAMTKNKGLSAEISVAPSLPTSVFCDSARIRQALVCLIENAIKFTHQGSVSLKVTMVKKQISFEVSDTGIGIDSTQYNNIFGAFTQADTSTTRQYGGLGLGLTLVKEIADLMSGSIAVQSIPEKGSTFTLLIPVTTIEEAPTPQVQEHSSCSTQSRQSLNILVVEDNLTNQKIIQKILNKLDFHRITVANNGEEGLLKLMESPFDIILMDCQMPIMDGYQATKAIRTSQDAAINTSIPIIAITANAMPGDREKCINAGMDDYLQKPVNFRELEEKIKQWTGVC